MADLVHSLLRNRPLLIGLLCGLAGILPDVDHIPEYITGGQYWAVIPSWPTLEDRPLHFVFLLIACAGIACSGGYLLLVVLKLAAHKILVIIKKIKRTTS
jgi:hypothetical protein